MAEINFYLKYENDDLCYCFNNKNFQPMPETLETGVDLGDTVNFIAADDSILSIDKIKVNEKKGEGKPFKKLWAIEPKPYDKSSKHFQGVIDDEIKTKKQVFNGYTIYYTTEDGKKEKDPDLKYPR